MLNNVKIGKPTAQKTAMAHIGAGSGKKQTAGAARPKPTGLALEMGIGNRDRQDAEFEKY